MRFRLIPKEESFFDLFEKASDNLFGAARLLAETMERFDQLEANALRMERLEHDGDLIIHEIGDRLNHSFITPIDREDIHQLASAMDDVLDNIEATTERFVLYGMKEVTAFARELADVIARQVEQIHEIIPDLRHGQNKEIQSHCVEINRLENRGDRIYRDALAELFRGNDEPIVVLKWHRMYDLLEAATDRCEDVADIIQSIVIKHG